MNFCEKWQDFYQNEEKKPYMTDLLNQLQNEYKNHTVYPPRTSIFAALERTPVDQIKVVILGQDPYHGSGQAHGLSFSVPSGIKVPPSLRNIFKELKDDLCLAQEFDTDLSSWADQGVLLLNATLTVKDGLAGSHADIGWQVFTDEILRYINEMCDGVVFILWGGHAQKKVPLCDAQKHLILCAAHPSPLSSYRGFFGSKPFSKTNDYLISRGKSPIRWESVVKKSPFGNHVVPAPDID